MKRFLVAVLGLYMCVLGAVTHRHVWNAGGVDWPWGLVAAIAVTYVVAVAAGLLARTGSACFALGWAGGLLALQWSPGDSYLIASDWLGWVFTGVSLGGIVLAMVRPPRLGQ